MGSVIGVPGGMASPLAAKLSNDPAAAQLKSGKGGDADTFGKNIVWVYDSNEFPATTAEKYHQFHDDFMRSAYDRQYHALQRFAKKSGCPGDAGLLSKMPNSDVLKAGMAVCMVSVAGLSVAWIIVKRKRSSEEAAQVYIPM